MLLVSLSQVAGESSMRNFTFFLFLKEFGILFRVTLFLHSCNQVSYRFPASQVILITNRWPDGCRSLSSIRVEGEQPWLCTFGCVKAELPWLFFFHGKTRRKGSLGGGGDEEGRKEGNGEQLLLFLF